VVERVWIYKEVELTLLEKYGLALYIISNPSGTLCQKKKQMMKKVENVGDVNGQKSRQRK
jgi:hypothetical protein